MADKIVKKKKPASADWFVQGVLTKIGDTFDRLTGRGWKPSSSLATSELAEKLKALVDAEIRETSEKRKYVPHNIKLKMQWDKFSTDSETALTKLENELLTSLIDHINDRRYYTYGPISLEVKPDYFTNGVKLFASFDASSDEEREVSVNVTVPNLKVEVPAEAVSGQDRSYAIKLMIRFNAAGKDFEGQLDMNAGSRFSVGRTKENDIAIDDASVSKMHASLVLNGTGDLILADTGSTNGTFINGERIAYGKANVITDADVLKFGTIEVKLEVIEKRELAVDAVGEAEESAPAEDTYRVGEFEFTSKIEPQTEPAQPLAETVPSIPMPQSGLLKPIATEPAPTEPYIQIDQEQPDRVEEK